MWEHSSPAGPCQPTGVGHHTALVDGDTAQSLVCRDTNICYPSENTEISPSLLSVRIFPISASSSQERMCFPCDLWSLLWSDRGGRPVYWTIVLSWGNLWWINRIWNDTSELNRLAGQAPNKSKPKLPFLVFVHFVPWWCLPCSQYRSWRYPLPLCRDWSQPPLRWTTQIVIMYNFRQVPALITRL